MATVEASINYNYGLPKHYFMEVNGVVTKVGLSTDIFHEIPKFEILTFIKELCAKLPEKTDEPGFKIFDNHEYSYILTHIHKYLGDDYIPNYLESDGDKIYLYYPILYTQDVVNIIEKEVKVMLQKLFDGKLKIMEVLPKIDFNYIDVYNQCRIFGKFLVCYDKIDPEYTWNNCKYYLTKNGKLCITSKPGFKFGTTFDDAVIYDDEFRYVSKQVYFKYDDVFSNKFTYDMFYYFPWHKLFSICKMIENLESYMVNVPSIPDIDHAKVMLSMPDKIKQASKERELKENPELTKIEELKVKLSSLQDELSKLSDTIKGTKAT